MNYYGTYISPLGKITLAGDGNNLTGLWIAGQKYHGGGNMTENQDLPLFSAVRNWLDRYFNGGKPEISELPLAPVGSEFRQSVWKILCDIPYGKVTTYGDIAEKLNMGKRSAQAVGGAVGHNPISIIIPCHRVIGKDGSMTGYAGGIDKKIKLLNHEGYFTVDLKL